MVFFYQLLQQEWTRPLFNTFTYRDFETYSLGERILKKLIVHICQLYNVAYNINSAVK